jgi:recombination protein RecT
MSTEVAEKKSTVPNVRSMLTGETIKDQLKMILPKHVTPERMVRVALTALTRTPKLAECEAASFHRCLMDCSQWGLEPDGRRAHLIPFWNSKRNVTECQLIIDYKGLAELCYRSGVVQRVHADVVRAGDLFVYSMGEVKEHVPHFLRQDTSKPENAGLVIAAYCIVSLVGGITKAEVMSREDVERIRNRSKAAKSGPWVTDWDEMAKKTVFKRVSKWLPLSAEIRDAIEHDDDNLADVIDATPRPALKTLDDLANRLLPTEPEPPHVNGEIIEPDEVTEQDDEMLAYESRVKEKLMECTTHGGITKVAGELAAATNTQAERDLLAKLVDAARAEITAGQKKGGA